MPSRRKRPVPGVLGWAFWIFFFLITILAALWVLGPVVRGPGPGPTTPPQKSPYPKVSTPSPHVTKSRPPTLPQRPLMAIIIDDMGQNPRLERQFMDLGLPLSLAFLPYAPYTRALATEAHKRDFEVLVHLPLEAHEHLATPGLITLNLSRDQTKYLVRQEILAVPYAVGVNHHMGSLFTEDPTHVRWVLEVVKELGLFYVDSRTTKNSVVPQAARSLGVPLAIRRVFLDHTLVPQDIRQELERAVRLARKKGYVVVIGHPHPQTLAILRRERAWLKQRVQLVPVSRVVERP